MKKKLLREGWLLPLLLLCFWRGKHGITEAFEVLFRVGKEDIFLHEAVYSRYDIWIIHSGMWSIISLIILGLVLYGWIKEVRKEAPVVLSTSQKPESDPGVVGKG